MQNRRHSIVWSENVFMQMTQTFLLTLRMTSRRLGMIFHGLVMHSGLRLAWRKLRRCSHVPLERSTLSRTSWSMVLGLMWWMSLSTLEVFSPKMVPWMPMYMSGFRRLLSHLGDWRRVCGMLVDSPLTARLMFIWRVLSKCSFMPQKLKQSTRDTSGFWNTSILSAWEEFWTSNGKCTHRTQRC